MTKEQKLKLNKIMSDSRVSALTKEQLDTLFEIINSQECEIKKKNNAIIELGARNKAFTDVISKQDDAIFQFKERIKEAVELGGIFRNE